MRWLPLLVTLALVPLPGPAVAAEHDVHDLAAYLRATGQGARASGVLAVHLADQPTDLRAQVAYIAVQVWDLGEGPFLETQYRAWMHAAPDDVARRVALASVLSTVNMLKGPWCEEADGLLQPLPGDPDALYQALLVRSSIHRTCELVDEGLADQLARVRATVPAGAWQDLRDRLRTEPLEPAALRRTLRRTPRLLGAAVGLWERDADEDPEALAAARHEALTAVRKAAAAKDPVQARRGLAILEKAGLADERLALIAHIERLDPGASAVRWAADPLARRIREDGRKADPQVALDALDALGEELPAAGALRRQLELARRSKLVALGRDEDAYLAHRAAHRADPTDAKQANDWAYAAAQHGRDLEEALRAVDAALAAIDAEVFAAKDLPRTLGKSPHVDGWLESRARSRGSYLDTRAWVLHALGRDGEAVVDMRRALLLRPGAVGHLHLGFIYEGIGDAEAAVEHLYAGLSYARQSEPDLALAGRALLGALAPTARPQWHPDGIDGLIAERVAARAAEDTPQPEPTVADPEHPLVGVAFPDLVVTVDGVERPLSTFPGPLVIDLWATWCGPCIEAMPHMADLAAAHAGAVTFVALSVDTELEDVTSYFEGSSRPPYAVAWFGRDAYKEAQIRAIPSVFVLDAEHVVTAYVRGYSRGDTRVDAAVAAMLAQ